jgi:Uma2 family endonuclease
MLDLGAQDDFFLFCQTKKGWHIERNSQGEILVQPPKGCLSSCRCLELIAQLHPWTQCNATGRSVSHAGFDLPNGAMRSPDAAWVSKTRLDTFTAEQKKKFFPLAPDFAAELRSESDGLALLQEKMEEYITCGVRLALLLDPTTRTAYVYRPNAEPQVLENPTTVDCSPELPGLTFDIAAIFDAAL